MVVKPLNAKDSWRNTIEFIRVHGGVFSLFHSKAGAWVGPYEITVFAEPQMMVVVWLLSGIVDSVGGLPLLEVAAKGGGVDAFLHNN